MLLLENTFLEAEPVTQCCQCQIRQIVLLKRAQSIQANEAIKGSSTRKRSKFRTRFKFGTHSQGGALRLAVLIEVQCRHLVNMRLRVQY